MAAEVRGRGDVAILPLAPPSGDSIALTAPNRGSRRFLRVKSVREDEEERSRRTKRRRRGGGVGPGGGTQDQAQHVPLLSTDINTIITRVSTNLQLPGLYTPRYAVEVPPPRKASGRPEALWVDRYAPTHFRHLLSNGRVNRELLRWLLQWRRALDDPTERPDSALVLLHGPPGIGKTTLAHVLARHCGFHAVDVNASDVRTGKSLGELLRNALSTRSIAAFVEKTPPLRDEAAVGNSAPNPSLPRTGGGGSMKMASRNCIILDEIDGVFQDSEGAGPISALCELIDPQRRPKDGFCVSSPIIAICNDVYAKPLRPLRTLAEVYPYHATTKQDLKQRLVEVAKEERYCPPSGLLDELVEVSNCDIRSALNSLQFLRCSSDGDVASAASMRDTFRYIGHKDVSSDIFELWDSVFTELRPDATRRFNAKKDPEKVQQEAMQKMRSLARSVDLEVALDGCFENAATVLAHSDPSMDRLVTALEAHSQCDSMLRGVGMNDTVRDAYCESVLVQYRLECANMSRPIKFQLPMGAKLYTKRKSCEQIGHALVENCPQASTVRHMSHKICTIDYAPLLAKEMSRVDPSAAQATRRQMCFEACAMMSAYGLSVVKMSSCDGPGTRFEPDLDSLTSMQADPKEMPGHNQVRVGEQMSAESKKADAARQLLFHATELFEIQRELFDAEMGSVGNAASAANGLSEEHSVANPGQAEATCAGLDLSKQKLLVARYRYQEGHTNAVRRPMRIRDYFESKGLLYSDKTMSTEPSSDDFQAVPGDSSKKPRETSGWLQGGVGRMLCLGETCPSLEDMEERHNEQRSIANGRRHIRGRAE